jgi:dihydrofolate reductase
MSLDGVIEDPQWTFKYWGDDIAQFKFNELFAHDDQLLGRVTYEGFAQAWPGRTDEQGYADRFNSMPKHVVSTTLTNPIWTNSRVISANVVDEIRKLRQQPGQDILVFGSDTLVQTLVQNDLVDRYNLLVYPVMLGKGKRLFLDGATATLNLVSQQCFASGVVAVVYETARVS